MLFSQHALFWWRGRDLNSRPLGYEPNELPGCSTPRQDAHYRRGLRPLSRKGRAAFAGGLEGLGGGSLGPLEQEDDLARARQAELLARDGLDAVGVLAQLLDVGHQARVLLAQELDLAAQARRGVPLAEPLHQPHVAEQRVARERP